MVNRRNTTTLWALSHAVPCRDAEELRRADQVLQHRLQIVRQIKRTMTDVGRTKYEAESSHCGANLRRDRPMEDT